MEHELPGFLAPTHFRMDGLMFGVMLAYFKYFRPAVFLRLASSRAAWIAIAAAGVLLVSVPLENHHVHTWGFTVVYLAAGCLLAKAFAFGGPRPVRFVSRLLARVGIYSYSIYLWHAFFMHRIMPHLHIANRGVAFLLYVPGAVLFGIAAGLLVELPALRLRERLFPGSRKEAAAVPNAFRTDPAPAQY